MGMCPHGYVPTRLCAGLRYVVMYGRAVVMCPHGYVRGYVRMCAWLCPCALSSGYVHTRAHTCKTCAWLCLCVYAVMSVMPGLTRAWLCTYTCSKPRLCPCACLCPRVQTYLCMCVVMSVCVHGYAPMCGYVCPRVRVLTRSWLCPRVVMSTCGYVCSHGYGYVCYVMSVMLCYVMLCLLCTHPPAVTIVYTSINILSSLYLRQHKNNLAR